MKSQEWWDNSNKKSPSVGYPWHNVLPGSVLLITTNSLTVGHHPALTSHHNGFWGQVPLLFSLAWKIWPHPPRKRQILSSSWYSSFPLPLSGQETFFPPEKAPNLPSKVNRVSNLVHLKVNGQSGSLMVDPLACQRQHCAIYYNCKSPKLPPQ